MRASGSIDVTSREQHVGVALRRAAASEWAAAMSLGVSVAVAT